MKPIYKQIVAEIEKAILNKKLFKNERLPSVNKVCLENNISRDTVLLAYEELKMKGIIYSITGKGYYVKTEEFTHLLHYFLLFDELNAFKEDLYTAFLKSLEGKARVDIYFHHFNPGMFRKLINDARGNYSKYIIMPSNLEGIEEVISTLPESNVIILDQIRDTLSHYPAIYQNFVHAVYESLLQSKKRLEKYNNIVLVFPGNKEPLGMKIGFEKYCSDFFLEYDIIDSFNKIQPQKGTVYIMPDDRDLVDVVEKSKNQKLAIGKDVGIISYNDTPLKKVVANGITTISTDFAAMGAELAQMLLQNKKLKIENPSRLILRHSF